MNMFFWLFVGVTMMFLVATEVNRIGDQRHHFWYGVWIVAFGLMVASPVLVVVGWGVMLDDALQHLVQWWMPAYRSPLHLAYRYTIGRWFT